MNDHHSAAAAAVARAVLVAMQRTRWERGMPCIVRAQGMAKAAAVRRLQVSVRRVDEEGGPSYESTSVGDIAPMARPSCDSAAWGARTSVSGLVSGLASERDTLDTVCHQRQSAPLAHAEEMSDAGLTQR